VVIAAVLLSGVHRVSFLNRSIEPASVDVT
jgi:hypothetical protein